MTRVFVRDTDARTEESRGGQTETEPGATEPGATQQQPQGEQGWGKPPGGLGEPPLEYRPAHASILDFWPPGLPENPVVLLQPAQFAAPCSNSPSKPIQTDIPGRFCKKTRGSPTITLENCLLFESII